MDGITSVSGALPLRRRPESSLRVRSCSPLEGRSAMIVGLGWHIDEIDGGPQGYHLEVEDIHSLGKLLLT